MSKLYCASGWHHPYYCLCPATCDVCGISTNHTTAQHEQTEAEQLLCIDCGQPHGRDDGETIRCPGCQAEYRETRAEWAREAAEQLSREASYYVPDEGGSD
jgi:hypothetical protein